ncbi:MAG TPA: lactate racemase domain-containing protein [Polyangiaceae bacterium]|nr:lactate racemase domain-containing protein [Polyangiaceae bacterium]
MDFPPAVAALVARGARLVRPLAAAERGIDRGSLDELCRRALSNPIARPDLASMVGSRSRVAVLVSDATRDEPRAEMFSAVRERLAHLPDAAFTIVVASGTHAPRPADTALDPALLRRFAVIVHDGSDLAACIDVGTTPEGTRVRLNRAVVETDLVVSLGRVRPHYFAGYSGGVKGVFPGCGHSPDVRQNHVLKADATARLGSIAQNRCRADMEAAVALLRTPTFLLNVVADCDNAPVDAVAGDIVLAHREATLRAAPWFGVRAPRARVIVTTDRPPVTSSLYQAAKLLPPAGAFLEEGGTAVLVADCKEGTGPLDIVNRGIYELGVRLAMPKDHVIRLVSELPADVAERTFARRADSIDAALTEAGLEPSRSLDDVLVLWRAGEMIPTP